jgi:hypothetical protein
LGPLFLPPPNGPALPAQFRQAVLVSFDANTGNNSVLIGQTTVTNLPMLVTGAEIGLEDGDNILVMYLGSTAMIVGKIATPGSANYGASNLARAGFVANASNWAVTTSGTTVITDTSITVPTWANSAQVIAFGGASTHNSLGTLDNWSSAILINMPGALQANSAEITTAVTSTQIGQTFAQFGDVIFVVPGATMTFEYAIISGGGTWAARTDNIATLFVAVEFFRESVQ